jgi:hypothetical protein
MSGRTLTARRVSAVAAFAATVMLTVAKAGPPFVTDDPDTPGPNHWEINVAYLLEAGREGIEPSHALPTSTSSRRFYEHAIPLLDINYGWHDNDQLKFEVPLMLLDPAEGNDEFGIGDARFGYKFRFVDEAAALLSMSVYPQIDLPSGDEDRGLGAGDPVLTLPFQLGKHFLDEQLFVYGDIGYEEQLADEQDDVLFFGIAAEFEVRPGLVLGGEIHHVHAISSESADDTLFNFGFKYDLTEAVTLLGAAGRSFDPSADRGADVLVYLGLQFRF